MKRGIIGLMLFGISVFGCGFASNSDAQKYGGTLVLGMYADILTPDLHRWTGNPTAQVAMLIADRLVAYNEASSFAPSLAESWKQSPDASEYTFSLRKGVLFHNGRELTAEDIKKNIEHLADEKTKSPRRAEFLAIKNIEVIDKYTVKFHLKEPDVGFLRVMQLAYITAPESFESKPPHPIGTGPFEYVEWKPRQHVRLKKFKNYWKKDKAGNRLPYVDELVLKPILDDTVRWTSLRTGDVDWVWTFPFEQIPENRKNPPPGIVPTVRGGVRWIHLGLNAATGPCKDVRVRQAIAYALDKKAIMDGLTWGSAPPEAQIYPPGSDWYIDGLKDSYAQPNLAKARELLKEAGYEKGLRLNTIVRNETFIINLATLVQAQLKKVGIDLQMEMMDRASHEARQIQNKFDVNPSHQTYVDDPDGIYYPYFHSKGGRNYARYSNAEFDKLIEDGRRTVDTAKRKEIYRKALELLNRDVPNIYLGHYPIAQAARTHLKNMKTNSRGDVSWSEGGASHAWLEK